MKILKTINPPETSENYVRMRRGVSKHLIDGNLSWDEYSLLLHLIIRANPKDGTFYMSYLSLSEEVGNKFSKNRINKIILSLKEKGYVFFEEHRGSGKIFELFINKYPLSGKEKTFLVFSNENSESEAELQVNPQNFRDMSNALAKEKSMNK